MPTERPRSFGGWSDDALVTEGGSVFVAGRFGDEVSAGEQVLEGAGGFDCYVGRLEP